ncbi:hypothetical protein VP1G_09153 [Cytospora mali]|uniref:Uncharacterized protein n=1 Tax=Cytospora mali TaxID=578113 RepID=A0A194VE21_CYTMA|nr:hypothetical protein VP1G_09153 [Valsa mali var. pyri (nom. inval.)]
MDMQIDTTCSGVDSVSNNLSHGRLISGSVPRPGTPIAPPETEQTTQTPPNGHSHGLGISTTSERRILGDGDALNIANQASDIAITQLSQLSMRLVALHRSCYNLSNTAEPSGRSTDAKNTGQMPILDDAAFESVTSWLARGSANSSSFLAANIPGHASRHIISSEVKSKGGILHNVFSASQKFYAVCKSAP